MNFRENPWVVDVYIVLLASLLILVLLLTSLYYFWHPCCCGSPFCCWRLWCSFCLCCCCSMFLLWVHGTVAGVPAECCWSSVLLRISFCLFWRSYCCPCSSWPPCMLASLLLKASLLLMVSIVCCRSCYCFHSCCCCIPAVLSSHDIAVILAFIFAAITVVACVTAVVASSLWQAFLLLLAYFSSWCFPIAGLPAIVGVPGVVGVSDVPFEHAGRERIYDK